MENFVEKVILPVALFLWIAILILLAVSLPGSVYASNICLQNGFPHGYLVFPYDVKCGRIVNQTEYVCNLNDVLSNSCSIDE